MLLQNRPTERERMEVEISLDRNTRRIMFTFYPTQTQVGRNLVAPSACRRQSLQEAR